MAAIHIYVPVKEPVDDLCPKCFNPALKRYVFETIDLTGITIRGHRTGCRDCKEWVSPIEPLKETA